MLGFLLLLFIQWFESIKNVELIAHKAHDELNQF